MTAPHVLDKPRIHFFFFYNGRLAKLVLKGHHVRDALAALQLLPALLAQGYELGRIYLNFPDVDRNDHRILTTDRSFLRPGDLLLVVTRPPLDDETGEQDIQNSRENRIRIERGFTDLEVVVFEHARQYFDVLRRRHIRLQPSIVEKLPADYATRADVSVRVFKQCAWLVEGKHLNGTGKVRFTVEPRTPVFLMRWNRVAKLGGADLVIVFGQAGNETLAWARRLGTDLQHLLDQPGFTFAEIVARRDSQTGEFPASLGPKRPIGLEWADELEIQYVLRLEEHGDRIACLPPGAAPRAPHLARPAIAKPGTGERKA